MAGILEPTEHVPAALAHPPTPPHTAQLIPRPPRPPAFDTPHPHSGPHTVQRLHRLPPRAHPRAGACVRMGGAVSSGGQAGGAAWQGTAGCAVGAQVRVCVGRLSWGCSWAAGHDELRALFLWIWFLGAVPEVSGL